MAIIRLFALAAFGLVSASNITIEEAQQYAQGFLLGLEKNSTNPGECYTELESFVNATAVIANDISDIQSGNTTAYYQLGIDLLEYASQYKSLNGTCNLTGLEATVKSLFTEEGLVQLKQRFYQNFIAITQDADVIYECALNYTACGEASGNIVSLLSGYSINTPRPVASTSNITLEEVEQYTQGFLIGLEQNSSSSGKCYSSLQSILNASFVIADDISNILDGNQTAYFQLGIDALTYASSYQSLNGSCNLTGLAASIESLLTPSGLVEVKQRFYQNFVAISKDITVIAECSQDYVKCGQASGNIASLLTAWQINSPRPLLHATPSGTDDLISGIISGLKLNESCTAGLESADTQIWNIVANIQQISAGDYTAVIKLVMNVDVLVKKLQKSKTQCDIKVNQVTVQEVVTDLITHYGDYSADFAAIQNCTANYYVCGTSVGDILSIFISSA